MLAALDYFRNDDVSNACTFVLDPVDLVAEHCQLMAELVGLKIGVHPFA